MIMSMDCVRFDVNDLKVPDADVPLYSFEEFEAAMKTGGTCSEKLAREEARGRGFGFVYMASLYGIFRQLQKKGLIELWGVEYEEMYEYSTLYTSHDVYDDAEDIMVMIRKRVDADMQQYIIDRDGVIDCWPEPTVDLRPKAERGQKLQRTKDFLAMFEYFRPDLAYVNAVATISHKRSKPVMQNTYKHKEMKKEPAELSEIEDRIRDLKKVPQYTEKQKKKNNLLFGIAMLPLAVALIIALVYLVWNFTGVQPREMLDLFAQKFEQQNVLYIIPMVFYGGLGAFYPFMKIWMPLFYITLVILVGAGAFCSMLLIDKWKVKWVNGRKMDEGKRARMEIENLEKSDEYKALTEAWKKEISWNDRLANRWHQAWFEGTKGFYEA